MRTPSRSLKAFNEEKHKLGDSTMNDFTELELQVIDIDDRLLPIATRPVDLTDPNWMTLLTKSKHPLDEAGVRSITEVLLESLICEYQTSDEVARRTIRRLFYTYRHFAWAATLSVTPTTEGDFRKHLTLFSMRDQGEDSRDALLELQELCTQARAAGVNTAPILREVAQMSSDENRFGMGSTRSQLDANR
jgi:hypothetical protein